MPDKPSPENPDPFITKEFRKDVLSNLWMSPRLNLEAAIGRLIASARAATESDKKDGKDGAADGVPGIRLDRNIEDGDDDLDGGNDDGGPDEGPGTGKESTDNTGKEASDGTGKESKESTDNTGKEASDNTGKESTDDTGPETSHVKTFEEDVTNIQRIVNNPDFIRAIKNFQDKVLNAKDTLDGVIEGSRRHEFDESENDTPPASSLDQKKLDDLEKQFDVRLKELIRTKRRII